MQRSPLTQLAVLLLAAAAGIAEEKPRTRLEILEKEFDGQIDLQVRQPHKAAVDALNKKYLESLGRIRQTAQQQAHLDEALAVTAEMERVGKGGGATAQDDPQAPANLKNLVAIYRTSLSRLELERDNKSRPLNEAHGRALSDLTSSLTKEGKLEEAKSAREKLEQVKGATVPAPSSIKPLQEFLVGTKWWWNGSKSWELTFLGDGTVEMGDWTRKGLVTGWKVSSPKEVRLTILKGRTTNKTATLIFAEDRDSFTGTDFGGKHPVAKSDRVKDPEPAAGPKP